VKLWRPVGPKELELIAATGYRAFPPRLAEQPIFYPVLTQSYAEQIARDWNAKREPYAGFVIEFEVDDEFVKRYEVHTVGNRTHQELWVPAKELEEFNRQIVGPMRVVAQFNGEGFEGERGSATGLPIFPPELQLLSQCVRTGLAPSLLSRHQTPCTESSPTSSPRATPVCARRTSFPRSTIS
jgi:hypothetical protein